MPNAKDFLPAPFDWCKIPAGYVSIEQGGYLSEKTSFALSSFYITKYPITNAQYALFVADGGYQNEQWWTVKGWQAKEEGWADEDSYVPAGKIWTEPRYWKDAEFNGDTKPVIGVSWYEAVAFCLWLSAKTSENIFLPTEQEWQRAAQAKLDGSDSSLAYVWGNQWEQGRCNNSVSPESSAGTTPVTAFEPMGNVSPCGVVDMIGNAGEWCLTDYDTGSQELVGNQAQNGIKQPISRGGSWGDKKAEYLLLSRRCLELPNIGFKSSGFRCVLQK